MSTNLKSPRRFKASLALKGSSVRSWAHAHGFNDKTVYGVLHGRLTGARGGQVAQKIRTAIEEVLAA